MKKTLLSLFMFVAAIATSWAGDVVFDFTNPEGLTPSVTPAEGASSGVIISDKVFTNSGVSISFVDVKDAQDTQKAKIWTNSAKNNYVKELRVMSGGTLIVTAESEITSIVFTGSSLAKFSVDGTALTDGKWSGNAKSVSFLASARVNINTITVTVGGEVVNPEPEPDPDVPAENPTLWSEAFDASQGTFTIEDKTLPEGLTYVWKWGSYGDDKYMKASAYANKTDFAAESWLVSPKLDLTNATEVALSFSHAGNYFATDAIENEVSVMACEVGGNWEKLTLSAYPDGKSFTFVAATADIAKYAGKKMQFAFVYKSTAEKAGTWEVKNVEITGKGSIATDAPEVQVPVYTSIAKLKEDATKTATAVSYEFRDLLVTGIFTNSKKVSSVYVTDGKEGMQFYGENEPTFKVGDRITGKVSGTLVLYNGLTEISTADYTEVTVVSENNAVVPTTLTIAQIGADNGVKTYENMLVKLEGISFAADKLANKNITMVDDSDNELTLRDNFGVLGDFIFNKTKTYNVTAVVANYNGTPQLYPLSADDVEMITNLVVPENAWESEEVVILPGEELVVANKFTTNSTAKVTYTSSDEAVATVDTEGKITVKGFGFATITAETEENQEYLASRASFKLYVIEGKGTLEEPYTAADAQYYNGKLTDKVWMKGIIIGYWKDNKLVEGATEAVASNIAIGTPECNVPVNLSGGSFVREDLNLQDHPEMLGKEVRLYGKLEKYFGVAGLKSVTDYSTDGVTAIEGVETDNAPVVIFSIDGRRLAAPVKGINIINGKKVLVK